MLSVNGAARVSSIVRRKPMARDIDQIIERLKTEIPSVQVTQLQVTHPGADDDGLWFIRLPGKAEEVACSGASTGADDNAARGRVGAGRR